ncbi:MAG: metallophosphoesterase [Alphaproteobacteria bacterium]
MTDQSRETAAKPSLLRRLGELLQRRPKAEPIRLTAVPVNLTTGVQLVWDGKPFLMTLGNVALEVHPDLALGGEDQNGLREWIVRARSAAGDPLPRFIRIRSNETALLGRQDDLQTLLFAYDLSVADRHVRIDCRAGSLLIQPLDSERQTSLSAFEQPSALWAARRERLMRLPIVVGRPIAPVDDAEALEVIREVNEIIAREAYREQDDDGVAGGIIAFPDDMPVVIMGDVHARADNILRVISEGGILAALEADQACLIFLGDLPHSEASDELEDMTSSMFVLDLFCLLKLRFPKNVFYIHGNHESFSGEVSKGGVPQGLLFRKYLRKRRGKAYVSEVEALFDSLAYVVQGNGFAACHGAPVRSAVDRRTLVNIRRYPGLRHEIVWNRLRQSSRPAGYGKGSVKRFRRTLDLPKHAPVIVGHTPMSRKDTIWMNVGDIQGHHIVYSAHAHRLAVFVARGGEAWPLELIPDRAAALLEAERGR